MRTGCFGNEHKTVAVYVNVRITTDKKLHNLLVIRSIQTLDECCPQKPPMTWIQRVG